MCNAKLNAKLTPLVVLLLLPFATACSSGPIAKAQLDAKVKRLCAIDGGIKVYETVRLPAERFDKYGGIRIPLQSEIKPSDEYYLEWKVDHLLDGSPSMRRDHFLAHRKSDGKLLGEAISYSRRGGDMPGPWHESSFRCPPDADDQDLMLRIFIKSN